MGDLCIHVTEMRIYKKCVDLEDQGFVVLSISADNARDASKVKSVAQSIHFQYY